MKRIANYMIRLMINYMVKEGVVKIENTPSKEALLKSVMKQKPEDARHSGWFHVGFVFVRFLDDYIEIKTESEYSQNKVFKVSMDEESLKTYFNYLVRI